MDVLECLTLQLPRDLQMLTRFYDELMIPNFPLKEELEPLEKWVETLEATKKNSPSDPNGGCYLNVMVCFDGKDKSRKVLLGGIVFEYYYPSNTALITYLVTNPAVRGQGSGIFLGMNSWVAMKKLARRHGYDSPAVIFCEVNDPDLISDSQDSLSPLSRLRAFQQMGVRRMENFKYVQPALEGQTERGRSMMLAVIVGPMTPRDEATGNSYVESAQVRAFLRDFYRELEVENIEEDVDFRAMLDCLKDRERVMLQDFDLARFKPSTKKKAIASTAPAQAPTIPVHIVVVGAGISGMAAARALIDAGFQVTIVEGRPRTGGRLHTARLHEARVDLGAAWLHGLDENPLADLIFAAYPDLKTYKNNEQSIVLFDRDGTTIDTGVIFECYMKFVQLLDTLKADYNPEDKDEDETVADNFESWKRTQPKVRESLQEAITTLYKKHPHLKYATHQEKVVMNHMFSQLESLQSAGMNNLNGRDYAHGIEYDGGDHIIPTGFTNVAMLLAKGLDIHKERKVNKIEYLSNLKEKATPTTATLPQVRVHIAGEDAPIACNGVLVTSSIGVLQSDMIQFSPSLPSWKSDSINSLGSGLFNKCVLRFPKTFWPTTVDYIGFNFPATASKEDLSLDHVHAERSNTWFVNYEPVAKVPMLIAMISGKLAEQMEAATDAEVVAEMMRRLRIMYGADVPNPTDAIVTRWGSDEYSKGSYSYLKKGASIVDFENVGKPVDSCLFFAGEHTSTNRFGYADGAYTSGLREAKRIVDLYSHLRAPLKAKL